MDYYFCNCATKHQDQAIKSKLDSLLKYNRFTKLKWTMPMQVWCSLKWMQKLSSSPTHTLVQRMRLISFPAVAAPRSTAERSLVPCTIATTMRAEPGASSVMSVTKDTPSALSQKSVSVKRKSKLKVGCEKVRKRDVMIDLLMF